MDLSWKQPTLLADTLKSLLKKKQYGKAITQQQIFENWIGLVGTPLAEKTRPQRIQQNILWIGVEHSSWIQELQFIKEPLLKKLQEQYPNSGIQKIRFVLNA